MKTLVVVMTTVLFGVRASAADRIQFMGLVTFVQPNGTVEAILPRVDGDADLHIHAHTAMIMFPKDSARPENWPMTTVNLKGEDWNYVELNSETVRFNREVLTGNDARPTFLPKLNDGCCGWIMGLDDDYEEHGNPAAAAHIVIPLSKLKWGQDPPDKEKARVDIMAILDPGPGSLVITAKLGGRERKLTFKTDAHIVIMNFPLHDITTPTPVPAGTRNQHPHFMAYYKMANLGRLCSSARVPEVREECKRAPTSDHLKEPLLLTIGAGFRGTDINCSNSTYP